VRGREIIFAISRSETADVDAILFRLSHKEFLNSPVIYYGLKESHSKFLNDIKITGSN
jgi:hypothetical protein